MSMNKRTKTGTCRGHLAGTVILLLLCLLCIGMPATAEAKKKTAVSPGMACKSGRYIYYTCNTDNAHKSGIMRYDTKKGKKKLIVDDWVDGRVGNGFYNITIKGKYIYAEWDRGWGPYTSASYIYRFDKNGKKKKKLATGRSPVVAGKYLYYIEMKSNQTGDTVDTGNVCRMKLNGKGKKKILKKKGAYFFRKLYSYGNTFLYSSYDSEDLLYTKKKKSKKIANLQVNEKNFYREGNYEYYWGMSGGDVTDKNDMSEEGADEYEVQTTLYRKDLRTGETQELAYFSRGGDFRVCGSYLIIKTVEKHKMVIYCLDSNTGKKKRLAKWTAEE